MRAAVVGGLLIVVVACVWWLLGGRAPPDRAGPPVAATPPLPTPTGRPAATGRTEPTRTGTLDVWVVRPGGEGVKAVPVVLAAGDREVARGSTDAAGWARFAGRTERELSVRLEPSGVRLPIGVFRPAAGDLTLSHVLHTPRSLVIRVFCEGERKLPENYTVAQPQLFDVRTEAGELHGRFYPWSADRIEVWLQAPGFVDGGGRVEADLGTEPAIATIHLRKVVQLRLRVAGPAGIVDHLTLEKHDDSWREGNASVTIHEDGFTYDVAPGRYRVVLSKTRAVVAEFHLDGPLDLDLDLSRAEWLTVHVEVPPRYDPSPVNVLAKSGAQEHYLPRQDDRKGATFATFVPGDRTVSIRASHPLLVPSRALETERGGTLTVRMRPGPLLRFRIVVERGSIYTLLYRPDDLEHPVFDGRAQAVPGHTKTYGLTGWEAGTYAVFVHFDRRVPVLRHVTIPADGLDLGTLPQKRGSWVRVTSVGGKHSWIRVESVALPRIRRRDTGYSSVTAKGLPAGSYRLRYGVGEKEIEEEIYLDGRTDLEREIALR